MCEATAMGAFFQFVGGTVKAMAHAKSAGYAAEVDSANADMARGAATSTRQTGIAEASKAELQGGAVTGKAMAVAGANGVDIQSGTVGDVLGSTRLMSKLNAATLQNNAEKQALNLDQQAYNFEAKSDMSQAEARWAWTDILGGAAQAGGTLAKGYGDPGGQKITIMNDGGMQPQGGGTVTFGG